MSLATFDLLDLLLTNKEKLVKEIIINGNFVYIIAEVNETRISESRPLLQFSEGETSFQSQGLLWKLGTNGLNVCEVTLLH